MSIKHICNLGAIVIENGPEIIQNIIFEDIAIDSPHRHHSSMKTRKQ
jgi:hypothetical protein